MSGDGLEQYYATHVYAIYFKFGPITAQQARIMVALRLCYLKTLAAPIIGQLNRDQRVIIVAGNQQ